MITEATTLRSGTEGKARSVVLVSLALGAVLAALVAMMAAPVREAEATFPGTNGKIVFISQRTTGTGVDNPTGDSEIFTIGPDGTGLKQLTNNTKDDREPNFSPDGQKIAYTSQGDQTSNPGGDTEVYLMNAADGSGQMNLSNNERHRRHPRLLSRRHEDRLREPPHPDLQPRGRLRGLLDESLGWVGTDKPLEQRRRRR